jgi:5,10-methylenetetrahydromethanopterin reductase
MRHATPELWTTLFWANYPTPHGMIERARQYEAEGWDGVMCPDSQNLTPDVYVCLTAIALKTRRLLMAPGVTNPATRHPAVTAGAIAAVQAVSNGRAVLAIGRGDSSLAHLGASPTRLGAFERYVAIVQRYLRGETLPLADVVPTADGTVAGFHSLAAAHVPQGSKLLWLRPDAPKVPVEVTATGPKAIAVGGRLAERVQLTLGSDPQRIAWGVQIARTAAEQAGRNPDDLSMGAYALVVPCRRHKARMLDLVRPMVATGARFGIMEKRIVVPASSRERRSLESLAQTYDMSQHARAGQQAPALDAAFVNAYAIVGPPAECIERLQALLDVGLDRFVISHIPIELPEHDEVHQRFVEEVMPALRR